VALVEIVIAVLEGAWLCEEKEIIKLTLQLHAFPKTPRPKSRTARNPNASLVYPAWLYLRKLKLHFSGKYDASR
jgi:hypothetical protein